MGGLSCLGLIAYSAVAIKSSSEDRIYAGIEEIPEREVALVLGCAKYLTNGRQNLYYKYRLNAAKELYDSGKVKFFIVSGDNSRKDYDEPSLMKEDLVAHGIPESQVYCDYAGFSTLDSVVRAKEIFGQEKLIIVSQEFHVRRAVFIGEAHDMDLIGYTARSVTGPISTKTELREHLARTKAVLDVTILGRRPKFLGEPIKIGKTS